MAVLVVAEDDAGTRKLLSVVLERMGHTVHATADGAMAWETIRTVRPDLILSDVNMPRMSGFELLDQVRAHPQLMLTPFVLLTSLQERRDIRQGMRMGADDYLTKPFQSSELRDAVQAQLNRLNTRAAAHELHVRHVVSGALEAQARTLGDDFEDRLAKALNEQWPTGERAASGDEALGNATVLCAGIEHYPAWLAALSADALSLLLKRFYDNSGDTVFLFGASTLQFLGEGVVAVFADRDSTPSAPHALRAIRAAWGLRNAAAGLQAFVSRQFPGRDLPRFDVSMALHSGPVALMRLEGLLGGAAQTVPVGATVASAMALQRRATRTHGPVTVSVPVLRSVTGAVRPVQRYLVALPHHAEPMDVCAVEPLPHPAA